MQCLINLNIQFFLISLLLWIFITCEDLDMNLPGQQKFENAPSRTRLWRAASPRSGTSSSLGFTVALPVSATG